GETASCTYRYYNSATLKSYDVIINVTIETPPAVVRTYQKSYSIVNPGNHVEHDPRFSIEDIMPEIQTLIGGAPDKILMSNSESEFQVWNSTDGWFGANGAAGWGTQAQMFCLKPNADGTFSYCAAYNDGECNAQCTYRYINTATSKAVDVEITIALTAPVVAD
ncbi:MAG: hypothetical protein IKC67_05305, partial [Odoribacter sp.]|nr:hypothetical protein [Odoribacter sp.]